jgi:hypothetical protein
MKIVAILISLVVLIACGKKLKPDSDKHNYIVENIPDTIPDIFKPELTPENMIIHRGIFSQDFMEYYYTISDPAYTQFTVKMIKKVNGKWGVPEDAFFNSEFNEHGMSFSPDGNILYFSSTRPIQGSELTGLWQIWRSERINGAWQIAKFVEILNLKNKHVSHPTVTSSSEIYFHSSNPDYSQMNLYYSQKIDTAFTEAKKVIFLNDTIPLKCTPFVSANASYMIFDSIGESLDLYISYRRPNLTWGEAKKLNKQININGQGNPFVSSDNKYLFFATANQEDWNIKWVSTKGLLKNLKN